MRDPADPALLSWLDHQPRSSIWTTSVTVLEIRFGLALLPEGRRRAALGDAFSELVENTLEHRITPFDGAAAEATARLMAARKLRGAQQDLRDSMIAGAALARRATLATRNLRHFADVEITIVDPWSLT
ncbi:PIN domain-containing protein [Terrarubrum flagellatum]|uniref:PIN domain-containing protein n=1 Tax=Terrirubrum flagellatum TaxID=2895980 RepID=UPI003144E7C2